MGEWVKVLYGLAASLLLGFGIGWIVCKLVTLICAGLDRRRANVFFTYAQIVGAAAMSFMHGAQDGQKFIGVLFLGMAFCSGQTGVAGVIIPVWLMILCSTIMGVGTSVGGSASSNPSGRTWSGWRNTKAFPRTCPVRCACW